MISLQWILDGFGPLDECTRQPEPGTLTYAAMQFADAFGNATYAVADAMSEIADAAAGAVSAFNAALRGDPVPDDPAVAIARAKQERTQRDIADALRYPHAIETSRAVIRARYNIASYPVVTGDTEWGKT